MVKTRRAKKDDQENTEEAFQLLRTTILDNLQIESTFWVSACWSVIANAYKGSGLTYEHFSSEIEEAKKFYKKHWKDSDG